MAVDTYLVMLASANQTNATGVTAGQPLLSADNITQDLADPFTKTGRLDPTAFFATTSFSTSVEQTVQVGSQSTGSGAGKVQLEVVTLTRRMDAVSPTLFRVAAEGTAFQFVDLLQYRSSAGTRGRTLFAGWRLGTAFVRRVLWSYDGDEPSETVEFVPTSLAVLYQPLDKSGAPTAKDVRAGWSVQTNKYDAAAPV